MDKKVLSKEEFIKKYGSVDIIHCINYESSSKLTDNLKTCSIKYRRLSPTTIKIFKKDSSIGVKISGGIKNRMIIEIYKKVTKSVIYGGEDTMKEENKTKEVQEEKLTQGEKLDKVIDIIQDEIVEEEVRKSLREHIVAGRYLELTDETTGVVLTGGKYIANSKGMLKVDEIIEELKIKTISEFVELELLFEEGVKFPEKKIVWDFEEVRKDIVERLEKEYRENEESGLTGYEGVEEGGTYYSNCLGESIEVIDREDKHDEYCFKIGDYYSKEEVCKKESDLINRYRVLKRDSVLNSKGLDAEIIQANLRNLLSEWDGDCYLIWWCNLFIDMLTQQK